MGTTCIQASVTNAAVTITGGGGTLAGFTGSGTYSFNDLFNLPDIESALNTAANAGKLLGFGVRAQGATSNADQLLVTLLAGKHTVRVLRPKDSGSGVSIGASGQFDVVTSPGAKCTLTALSGKSKVTIGTATLPKSGTRSFTISSAVAKKLKTAKITKGKKFTLSASCVASKQTATLKKSVTYTG